MGLLVILLSIILIPIAAAAVVWVVFLFAMLVVAMLR